MVENSIPPNSKERLSKISLERQKMANSSFKSFPPDQFRYHPIYIYIYIYKARRGEKVGSGFYIRNWAKIGVVSIVVAKSARRGTRRELSGYPVLSTRSNFASSYLCSSPPLSSTSTTRVAKLSMPGRLFRPPPSNFQKQAGSWPQKGGWSFRGTLSKTCRSDTSRECSPTREGERSARFEFSQGIDSSNKFS